MNSAKTTISGLLSATTSFILFSQQLNLFTVPKWAAAVALFANVGGLAFLGVTAKDYNVSGGATIGKPSTAEALVESHGVKPQPPKGAA